jgi:hypothetical protein
MFKFFKVRSPNQQLCLREFIQFLTFNMWIVFVQSFSFHFCL